MEIIIASTADLSRPIGTTSRILALASELGKNGIGVTLIAPKPSGKELVINLENNIEVYHTPVKIKTGSPVNMVKRTLSVIKKVKEVQMKESMLLIETSTLGGYFAFSGFSNYVLDVHGFYFDEVKYSKLPWYVPLKPYQKCIYILEKRAVKHASRIVTVSNPMKDFIKDLKIPDEKIEVIPNGYFEDKIKRFENIKEIKGTISFVGALTIWANVGKVIEAAHALKEQNTIFYIIGDGEERKNLEQIVKKYDLDNVIFTGFVPMDIAYELMAKSEILLAPFPKILALGVACPIKLLEYMALGKVIVTDDIGEIPTMLKENKAALVSNPLNQNEFIENIQKLLDDNQLKKEMASNAKKMAKSYTWEKQGEQIVKMFESLQKVRYVNE